MCAAHHGLGSELLRVEGVVSVLGVRERVGLDLVLSVGALVGMKEESLWGGGVAERGGGGKEIAGGG